MKIACIGWGSLVWDKRDHNTKGEWHKDGPFLPIEFARQSSDGRITLVICRTAKPVKTFWVLMNNDNLEDSIESLRKREGTISRHIHFVEIGIKPKNDIERIVSEWAIEKNLNYVIWTGLPPKFNGQDNVAPSIEELTAYFRQVEPDTLIKAAEYIENTPDQINTSLRNELEQVLLICSKK